MPERTGAREFALSTCWLYRSLYTCTAAASDSIETVCLIHVPTGLSNGLEEVDCGLIIDVKRRTLAYTLPRRRLERELRAGQDGIYDACKLTEPLKPDTNSQTSSLDRNRTFQRSYKTKNAANAQNIYMKSSSYSY
eukprot:807338-Pleurochrysis_carterae.AAC.3